MLSSGQLERASEWYRRGYLDAQYGRCMPRQLNSGSFAHKDYYDGLANGANDKQRFEEFIERYNSKWTV